MTIMRQDTLAARSIFTQHAAFAMPRHLSPRYYDAFDADAASRYALCDYASHAATLPLYADFRACACYCAIFSLMRLSQKKNGLF